MTFVYGIFFTVSTLMTLAYTGGKTQLSREELLASPEAQAQLRAKGGVESEERVEEMNKAMNKVLFETKGDMRQEWAIKRDEARRRKREEHERNGTAGSWLPWR